MSAAVLYALADHYERAAMRHAMHLFKYGVSTGYAINPESHEAEVAYVANCFTVAAALRAQATTEGQSDDPD